MRIKKLISLCLTVVMVVTLAGCGTKTSDSKNKGDSAKSGEDITIRMTTRWSGEDPAAVYFRDQIKVFNDLDNGITVVADNIGNEDSYLDKLRTQIATGNQPEIFIEYGGSRISDYVEGDILLDIQPYLDADPEWRDGFLNLFDKWQYEGMEGTYGVPCQFYSILLFYNKRILEENGIEVPKTMDEFKQACDTLVKKGKVAMKLGEKEIYKGGHFFNNIVYKAYGCDIVKDLGDRSLSYDDQKMLDMYALIKEFNDNGWFGPNPLSVDGAAEMAAFTSGESAFDVNGTFSLGEMINCERADELGVVPFPSIDPQFENHGQGGAADGYSVSKRDDKTNEASITVLKYFTSAEYFQGMEKANNGGVWPVKFETADGVVIDDLTKGCKEIIGKQVEVKDDIQTYDQDAHMPDTVRNAIQGLFIGNTPEECAKEILEKIKANE